MDKDKIAVIQDFAEKFYKKLLRKYPHKNGYKLQHNVEWYFYGEKVVSSIIWNDRKTPSYKFNYIKEHYNNIQNGLFSCD